MGATKKDRRINAVLSVLLTILCIAWMYPVFMILMNSLKTERAITTSHAFELPNAETFVGLKNYIYGMNYRKSIHILFYDIRSRRFESVCLWHAKNAAMILTFIAAFFQLFPAGIEPTTSA